MSKIEDHEAAKEHARFKQFMELMKNDPRAAHLNKQINAFIAKYEATTPSMEKGCEMFQEFLEGMEDEFRRSPVWRGKSDADIDAAVEGCERYVTSKLYHLMFARSGEVVEEDGTIARRLAALLPFVSWQHLDIPPLLRDDLCCEFACKELAKLEVYKPPRDKLQCLMNCVQFISGHFSNVAKDDDGGSHAGADAFVPFMIYVVIKAQPRHLSSNIAYIQSFRRRSKLVGGEHAYFLTTLDSVKMWCLMLTPSSLTMDGDEFVARMMDAGIEDAFLAPSSISPQVSGAGLQLPSIDAVVEGASLSTASTVAATHAGHAAPHVAEPLSAPLPVTNSMLDLLTGDLPTAEASDDDGASSAAAAATAADEPEAALPVSMPPSSSSQHTSLPPTADLINNGADAIVKAGGMEAVLARHPYLQMVADDLTVSQVADLLQCYKDVVLRFECLCSSLERFQQH